MYRSINIGARAKYSAQQVSAWCPKQPEGPKWKNRLSAAETIVAERDGAPIGFMTMDKAGYIDLAFVMPEDMGKGVSGAIYAVLESRARKTGLEKLSTQASLLAEPFFANQGWQITSRQDVNLNGVFLQNAWMEKSLI